jgi:hypothetical protein
MTLPENLAAVNRALDAHDVQRGRELIAPLLTSHPDSADVLWTAGRFLGVLGAHQQAAAQFKRAVQTNDIAVDVGAHLGGVSIVLATLHPYIRVIALEPASSNYASLCVNLKENGITNVTAVNKAVMGERGLFERISPRPTTSVASTVRGVDR